jgi:hypothetical protein
MRGFCRTIEVTSRVAALGITISFLLHALPPQYLSADGSPPLLGTHSGTPAPTHERNRVRCPSPPSASCSLRVFLPFIVAASPLVLTALLLLVITRCVRQASQPRGGTEVTSRTPSAPSAPNGAEAC